MSSTYWKRSIVTFHDDTQGDCETPKDSCGIVPDGFAEAHLLFSNFCCDRSIVVGELIGIDRPLFATDVFVVGEFLLLLTVVADLTDRLDVAGPDWLFGHGLIRVWIEIGSVIRFEKAEGFFFPSSDFFALNIAELGLLEYSQPAASGVSRVARSLLAILRETYRSLSEGSTVSHGGYLSALRDLTDRVTSNHRSIKKDSLARQLLGRTNITTSTHCSSCRLVSQLVQFV